MTFYKTISDSKHLNNIKLYYGFVDIKDGIKCPVSGPRYNTATMLQFKNNK